ncbi:MAG: triose-phosphate isomerase family protein, partial [Bacteroidota bacterium]
MRKQIVAGNWKMNCDLSETKLLLEELTQNLTEETSTEVIVSPPYTSLMYTFDSLKSTAIKVAAQNLHPEDNGAFTGEISAKMLKSVGVSSVIIGHSERRSIFQESNEFLAEKVNQAI